MNIKIANTFTVTVPKGTKDISDEFNPDWVTLARKNKNNILLFTCLKSEIHTVDLLDDYVWTELTPLEVEKLASL